MILFNIDTSIYDKDNICWNHWARQEGGVSSHPEF